MAFIQAGPPECFIQISITTPIASALKNYYSLGLSRSFNGFFKALLDPGDRFASETAARRFQK
jgi:hypothetical protein